MPILKELAAIVTEGLEGRYFGLFAVCMAWVLFALMLLRL
jgi:hypothetical protein